MTAKLTIRRARPSDAEAIHYAHMRSIQELCADDYSENEILAWGHRPFDQKQRVRDIEKELVWVVEKNGNVEGYAHLVIEQKNGFTSGHVWGLYLTTEVQGQGQGAALFQHLLAEAKSQGAHVLRLESTLTAHKFYRSFGFIDAGHETTVQIGDAAIRCIPMVLRF